MDDQVAKHPLRSSLQSLRQSLDEACHQDETACIAALLKHILLSEETLLRIEQHTYTLVEHLRSQEQSKGGIDGFMLAYDLSSDEGIALMCLAEALLRIPDNATIDKLIKDKISKANWQEHLGKSTSAFVNAATWSLMFTGKVLNREHNHARYWMNTLNRFIARSSDPMIRTAVTHAMRLMSGQFVMGQTIEAAIKRVAKLKTQFNYSYDMLGEAARTHADAMDYFKRYEQAIIRIAAQTSQTPMQGDGVSVKLSALHPRYEYSQRERILRELVPRLTELVLLAKQANIGLTIDAEEADRLDLSLDVIAAVFNNKALGSWSGFGVAVQAYQKRAPYVIDWLNQLAKQHQRTIMVRLVKGAYWDYEIKHAQEMGFSGYPVFTRKQASDVSYAVCAQKLIASSPLLYPQFATHDAYTVALILELTQASFCDFEFQRLHGMGEALYAYILDVYPKLRCRVYAPVGTHEDLLGFLVRRLLENGANTSFVNRINDAKVPIADLVKSPLIKLQRKQHKPHPNIVLPEALYGPSRKNSLGLDLSQSSVYAAFQHKVDVVCQTLWIGGAVINGTLQNEKTRIAVMSPQNMQHQIGWCNIATREQADQAMALASQAQPAWDALGAEVRATTLLRLAEQLEKKRAILVAFMVLEAGKSLPNALAEVREAVDFCRYYAQQALMLLQPQLLPGPTGELNRYSLHGRGVIVCISPWNFPLAIFLGQITAALVAGNTVVAKPATQTSLLATYVVQLAHQAGIPFDVLHSLPGEGSIIGEQLISDPRTAGVMLTGSTQTAQTINQTLSTRGGPIVPFIAETGGQNAMIVDSSALLEQVVIDIIHSAFDSAGQRCSALRVLCVQADIADQLLEMLSGAMAELNIGDPMHLSTDVGPVIDSRAYQQLTAHITKMQAEAKLIYRCQCPSELDTGLFIPPCAFEIEDLAQLTGEVFGPIVHVIRFASNELEQMVDAINTTGYGLTFGIHTRIEQTIQTVCDHIRVGNIYVNRNMVGAIVGSQPFGGQGLSGTGPKAGGPQYLLRLVHERSTSINTTAMGGNAHLLSLDDDLDEA